MLPGTNWLLCLIQIGNVLFCYQGNEHYWVPLTFIFVLFYFYLYTGPTRFRCLKYLDVSGIRYDEFVSSGLLPLGIFPPTIETLKMSNCLDFIGDKHRDISGKLASAYKHLRVLDISINDMDKSLLVELSEGLDVLEYLDICGKHMIKLCNEIHLPTSPDAHSCDSHVIGLRLHTFRIAGLLFWYNLRVIVSEIIF